jgi:hypothetical protein
MPNTELRPTATEARLFNRRTALRFAATAVPVGAALVWPAAMSNAATTSAAQINIIDAVSQTLTAPFTLGATKPSAENTGVATGSTLTVVNGDLNMVAGKTYQNLDIHGFVNGAAGATLLNSRVRGRGTGYVSAGLVNGNPNTQGMKISRCTLLPDVARYFLNGFNGSNCLIERCDISNVVDAIHATGNNVLVHGNYIHDFSFFDGSTGTDHANDAVHPGWTHNDAMQHMGGSGMAFIGNNVQAYFSLTCGTPNTALRTYPKRNYCNGITISPSGGRISGFKISQNWFEGGDVLVQIPTLNRGYDNGNNGEISYNRCGADQKPLGSGRRIQMRSSSGMGTYSGLNTNTFDTVSSVPEAYRGKPLIAQAGSGNGTPGMSLTIIL